MKKGYAIVVASGWSQCDTDEDLGDFGFAASVDDVYFDYNKAVEARESIISADKNNFAVDFGDEGDADRIDFDEGEINDYKYIRFILDDVVQSETKYYIRPVNIND